MQRLCDSEKLARLKEGRLPGYDLWHYDRASKRFVSEGEDKTGSPQFLILQESPLYFWKPIIPDEIRELLGRQFVLDKEFLAYRQVPERCVFNDLDAFYVPLSTCRDYLRPGPNIRVYKKSHEGSQQEEATSTP